MGLRDLLRAKKEEPREPVDPPAATLTTTVPAAPTPRRCCNQAVELGTINYVNLTPDGRHGDVDVALRAAQAADRPLFVNFVEWSG